MKNLKKHGCQKQVVVTILAATLDNNSINYLQKIGSLLSEDIKVNLKLILHLYGKIIIKKMIFKKDIHMQVRIFFYYF